MAVGWRVVGGPLGTSPTLLDMNQHNLTPALAEARLADLQRAAAHSTATVPRRHLRAVALLALAATAALAPTGALAKPAHDPATPANAHAGAVYRDGNQSATLASITFTNPLGRSRGPGTGGGQL
jgi:hypothetical protein